MLLDKIILERKHFASGEVYVHEVLFNILRAMLPGISVELSQKCNAEV